MSTPGWYPDPQGGPQSRFWDGSRWTDQTRPAAGGPPQQPASGQQSNPQGQPGYPSQPSYGQGQPYGQAPTGYQSQQSQGQSYWSGYAGQPPYGGAPQTGGTPPPKPTHLPLWIALGVSVALIIGIGGWLLLRPQQQSTTQSPAPTASRPASPSTSTSTEPSPSDSMTAAEPTPPKSTTADPTPAGTSPQSTPALEATTIKRGDVIKPATCTGSAKDAIGKVGTDGRVISGGGLSFPEITGWVAAPVQYPWIYKSNSQKMLLGPKWMASMTVGTLNAADGFTAIEPSALRIVECLLGSEFYGSNAESMKVTYVELQSAKENYWLDAEVKVTGVEGVTIDSVAVGIAKRGSVMHVVVGSAPLDNKPVRDALLTAFDDLKIA